jgi:hypothetical protein
MIVEVVRGTIETVKIQEGIRLSQLVEYVVLL